LSPSHCSSVSGSATSHRLKLVVPSLGTTWWWDSSAWPQRPSLQPARTAGLLCHAAAAPPKNAGGTRTLTILHLHPAGAARRLAKSSSRIMQKGTYTARAQRASSRQARGVSCTHAHCTCVLLTAFC
jgi:hypothetical protein